MQLQPFIGTTVADLFSEREPEFPQAWHSLYSKPYRLIQFVYFRALDTHSLGVVATLIIPGFMGIFVYLFIALFAGVVVKNLLAWAGQ